MKAKLLAALALPLFFFALSSQSFAHHSWNAYDLEKWTTLKGTVTRFQWTNPHISIEFDAKDAKGDVQNWVAGGPSPSRMNRGGWDKGTVKPGDPITVVGNVAKDGSPSMRLGKATLANGQELIVYGNR